jgi:uncharacterized protein (TIGR00255 family)
MIKSMTGFGKGEFTDGKRNVICEIRSVNHRYSDIFIKMPRRYSFAEEKIKSIIKETVKRGKVEVSVVVESITEEDITIKLNPLVARQYIDNLRMLKDEFGLEGEISLETIANLPDVMKNAPDIDDEEEVTSSIEEAVRTAVANLDQMRVIEGQKLAEDLTMRGELIRKYVSEIEERAPEIVKEYKQKLYDRISELVEGMVEVPDERILLEAAVFADKTNITEELVRLDSHISQLHQILGAAKSNGKKLDFLVQEMNREANTIGSKANDNDITGAVIEIKSEVEKIREQVQNIE